MKRLKKNQNLVNADFDYLQAIDIDMLNSLKKESKSPKN